jgi:hypothetical protein
LDNRTKNDIGMGHVVCTRDEKLMQAFFFFRKTGVTKLFGLSSCRWEDNIFACLSEALCEDFYFGVLRTVARTLSRLLEEPSLATTP